jgi:hypothetical protein
MFIVFVPAILIEVMDFIIKQKPGRNCTRGQREKEKEISREISHANKRPLWQFGVV